MKNIIMHLQLSSSLYLKHYKGVNMKTLKEAKAIVGGLSNPSKMPDYGYGLSAFDCAVGSKLRLIKIVLSRCVTL